MYSLDVNFLRERKEQPASRKETPTEQQEERTTVSEGEGRTPLFIGIGVGVALPAAVFGYNQIIAQQTQNLEREVSDLQQELNQFQAQQEQVTQKQEELKRAQENLTAFADIFNTIKPISAILQDVRDRAPSNVQVNAIQESEGDNFVLAGVGRNYEAVNYLFLTLQRSPLVQPESVTLQTASETEFSIEFTEELPDNVEEIAPPDVISYSISFQLNDKPASTLIGTLEEKGATGLVTRIRTLQQKGIVE